MKILGMLLVGTQIAICAASALGEDGVPPIAGVFGLSRVTPDTYIAVWVPVADGAAVTGVRWYQNDGETTFSEISAAAGVPEWPRAVSTATPLLREVAGTSLSWSEATFAQPIASDSGGLYLFLRIQQGAVFPHTGIGGGFGVGYLVGDGIRRGWLSGDGEQWNPIRPDWQLAIAPILEASKSLDGALVLNMHSGAPVGDRAAAQLTGIEMVAFPNPSNPCTQLQFAVPKAGSGRLEIYDIRGRLVVRLLDGEIAAGAHTANWSGLDNYGRQVASGVYFARLDAGGLRASRSIVLLR